MKKATLILIVFMILGCREIVKKKAYVHGVTSLKELPEPITNNAISEGFINGEPFVFTFAGLDSTKEYSGIHLRSYKYDVSNKTWERITDLPDTLGKIASAASRVRDTIYIIGGYHVFEDHSEKSSNKVHRYNIVKNKFIEDGTPIPVPIDDQFQGVWRDSLIYVVTGWSDKENMPNVQIYNPSKNEWFQGTKVPNNHIYKSFGASGTIVADTIFYFGGASMGKHYPIQNILRKGVINPNDPTKIEWSHAAFDSTTVGYRMASTSVNNKPYWLGGSIITYNYNPIAYNGSGGVNPANRTYVYDEGQLKTDFSNKFPMDLRGIAEINDSTKIIAGGILENQKVSSKVYQVKWTKE